MPLPSAAAPPPGHKPETRSTRFGRHFQVLILAGLLAASAMAVLGTVLHPLLETPEPPEETAAKESAPPNPFDADPWTKQEAPSREEGTPSALASASFFDLTETRRTAPEPEVEARSGDRRPVLATPDPKPAAPPGAFEQPAAALEEEKTPAGPLRVEVVSAERSPDGSESMVLRASGPFTPQVYPLKGKNPFGSTLRLVVDVRDVDSVAESVSGRVLNGRILKRVRTSFAPKARRFRAVLDLDPDTPFQMEQEASAGGERFTVLLKGGRKGAPADEKRLAAPLKEDRNEATPGGVLVRAITLRRGEGPEGDRLLIQADRFFEPLVFGLEGANPYGKDNRLVVDIPRAAPPPPQLAASAKNGRLVRAVRTHYHERNEKLRVVLDLAPAPSYEASQAFYSKQNVYCLSVQDPSDVAESAPPPEKEAPLEKTGPALPRAPDVQAARPPARTGSEKTAPLRSNPADLTEDNLRAMFEKHGFYSTCGIYNAQYCNQGGDFANRFQPCGPGIVCDRATGLMWERAGSPAPMPWDQALARIRDRNRRKVGGHRDWRLPTLEELLSLMERSWGAGGLYIDDLFDTTPRSCWSGDLRGDERAWKVNFHLGYAVDASMKEGNWVRAVRTLATGALRADAPPLDGPEERPRVARQRKGE